MNYIEHKIIRRLASKEEVECNRLLEEERQLAKKNNTAVQNLLERIREIDEEFNWFGGGSDDEYFERLSEEKDDLMYEVVEAILQGEK